jgi:hypothetical protein
VIEYRYIADLKNVNEDIVANGPINVVECKKQRECLDAEEMCDGKGANDGGDNTFLGRLQNNCVREHCNPQFYPTKQNWKKNKTGIFVPTGKFGLEMFEWKCLRNFEGPAYAR